MYPNPEYEKLLPPLSKQEYESLKNSISQYGILTPISYNKDGLVLDGHTRLKIAKELSIKPKLENKPLSFSSKLEEKLWVINANLERRHLTAFQKVELRLMTKPILSEIAKLNMLSGVKVNPKQKFAKGVNCVIGKEVDVSKETVRKVETLLKNCSKEQLNKLRTGKTSISRAFTNYKRSQDHQLTPKLPNGKYDVILADCPWKYDQNMRDAHDHYQVMNHKEIGELKIPSADNCVLFLWATQPTLKEALYVLEHWGFNYKSGAVWIKDKIGTGYYFRFRHELLLIGVKGTMPIPNEKDRPNSVIEAPRTNVHSEKPKQVYQMIERMYPNRKYLELFARTKYNDRWAVWGIEAPAPVPPAN